jgi:hypothetical protein
MGRAARNDKKRWQPCLTPPRSEKSAQMPSMSWLIGQSGMSRVYRTTDTPPEEAEVAIKLLSDFIIRNAEYEQGFMQEIEIACML